MGGLEESVAGIEEAIGAGIVTLGETATLAGGPWD